MRKSTKQWKNRTTLSSSPLKVGKKCTSLLGGLLEQYLKEKTNERWLMKCFMFMLHNCKKVMFVGVLLKRGFCQNLNICLICVTSKEQLILYGPFWTLPRTLNPPKVNYIKGLLLESTPSLCPTFKEEWDAHRCDRVKILPYIIYGPFRLRVYNVS